MQSVGTWDWFPHIGIAPNVHRFQMLVYEYSFYFYSFRTFRIRNMRSQARSQGRGTGIVPLTLF
jgi:hypothetical protein